METKHGRKRPYLEAARMCLMQEIVFVGNILAMQVGKVAAQPASGVGVCRKIELLKCGEGVM